MSVLVVCHDGEAFLGAALESVRKQTTEDWEVVFFDNGSTDRSSEIARGFGDSRFRLRRTERRLPLGEARGRSLEAARADLVAFLDADDTWEPEKLERQLPLLGASSVGLVFSDARIVDGAGRLLGRYFHRWPPSRGRVHADLVDGNFVPLSTVLARKALLEAAGGFRPGLQVAADYDLWLRLSRRASLEYAEEALASWRVHGGNLTREFGRAYRENAELYRGLLEAAPAAEKAYRARVRRALAVLHWKWAARSFRAGEGVRDALDLVARGARWSGGPGRLLLDGGWFVRRQLRGLGLRAKIEAASEAGA